MQSWTQVCDARIMALSYLFPHSSALCECLQAALTVWLLFGYCRAERWAAQWCLQQHLAVNETLHRKVIKWQNHTMLWQRESEGFCAYPNAPAVSVAGWSCMDKKKKRKIWICINYRSEERKRGQVGWLCFVSSSCWRQLWDVSWLNHLNSSFCLRSEIADAF